MRKILISILFAIIASMLCHAQDDSIFYLMPNEEPIIKKHIDRLEILNNRLNKLGINTEQKTFIFISLAMLIRKASTCEQANLIF